MSEVTITCPYCGSSLSGDSAFLGEEVGCPDCGNNFIAEADTGRFEEQNSPSDFRYGPGTSGRGGANRRSSGGPVYPNGERGAGKPSSGRRGPNDSVFTNTEINVLKSVIPRRQPSRSARSASSSAASVSPAKRGPASVRKKLSFDQRFGLGDVPHVFKLNSAFWTFFALGLIILCLGVFIVFDASGYDGSYRDWGASGVRGPDAKGKWDASVGESSYVAARNTAVLCEGMKYINRNIANVGSHYQGLHEMFVGFMLIFVSGFFFFCSLISFLYSARMPAERPSEKETTP